MSKSIYTKNIFFNKSFLIYGLGKSGISSYKFLKNKFKVKDLKIISISNENHIPWLSNAFNK